VRSGAGKPPSYVIYPSILAGVGVILLPLRYRKTTEKARGLRADKKVECEKTRRKISGLKR
jgi:hypothetical protein